MCTPTRSLASPGIPCLLGTALIAVLWASQGGAQTCTTEPASAVPAGTGANNVSRGPILSADGRFVAFTTTATNIVVPTQPGTYQQSKGNRDFVAGRGRR